MENIERLKRLAKQTGDRLIVHDSFTGESYVLMSVDRYEELVGPREGAISRMSSDELLDQINRDIAIWREQRERETEELDAIFRPPVPDSITGEMYVDDDVFDDRGIDDMPDFDLPFDEDMPVQDRWERAGDIVSERYEVSHSESPSQRDTLEQRLSEMDAGIERHPIPERTSSGEPMRERQMQHISGDDPVFLEEPVDEL